MDGWIFQSTFPLQGTTYGVRPFFIVESYFNPRSHCRERLPYFCLISSDVSFQSTFPLQGTTVRLDTSNKGRSFQSTFPLQGTTDAIRNIVRSEIISIHVPIAGNDDMRKEESNMSNNFNPRSHCRERPRSVLTFAKLLSFQSTFPLQGTTELLVSVNMIEKFQSTFPLQGTTDPGEHCDCRKRFQSTFPLQGTTTLCLLW